MHQTHGDKRARTMGQMKLKQLFNHAKSTNLKSFLLIKTQGRKFIVKKTYRESMLYKGSIFIKFRHLHEVRRGIYKTLGIYILIWRT